MPYRVRSNDEPSRQEVGGTPTSPLGGRPRPPRGDTQVPLTIQEPSKNHPCSPPSPLPPLGEEPRNASRSGRAPHPACHHRSMAHENNVDRWPTGSPLLVQVKYYIDSKLAGGGGGGNPELEQRVTDLETTTATQAGQIAAAQSDITDLETTTATQAGEIAALQQQNTDQAGQISQAQADIAALTTTQDAQAVQITDLETRVAALEAQDPAVPLEAIYVWDGGSYNVPDTQPEGIILRSFYGPDPYQGDPWPGVLDAYTFAETVA